MAHAMEKSEKKQVEFVVNEQLISRKNRRSKSEIFHVGVELRLVIQDVKR